MLNHVTLRHFVILVLICAMPASAYGRPSDPAEVAFKKLFDKEVRAVRQTKETDDDAAFATRLYQEAESGKHAPDLTTRLYEKAYAFGLRDLKGYPTAGDALDQLLQKDETRKYDVGEMRLTLWDKWREAEPEARELEPGAYIDLCLQLGQDAVEANDLALALKFLNRGNRFASRYKSPRKHDVRDMITDLMRERQTREEIAELEDTLGKDPTAADKLALVYLAHRDDPAKAVAYADQISDAALAAKVRLAATGFEQATPQGANEASAFYYSLVTENKSREPVAMLIRARVWLTEYLSRAPADADAVKIANETLGEIDGALLKRGIGRKLRRKMSSVLRGEGPFGRPPHIQAAVDKGVAWLYAQRNNETHWEKDQPNHRNYGGYTALVVYALLMADEEPKLNGDLSRSLHFMMNTDMKGTYSLCFRIHAWEVLPRRERYQQILMQDVMQLRKGATRVGFWGYTMSGKDVKPKSRLDVSTTLAGGLGLWIGEEVGGITPKKTYWERVARGLIEYQLDDNGWCYNPATGTQSQGAMTAGALALLYASYPHLGAVTKAKADEAIARGVQWMDENFDPTKNVNRNVFKYYYFAAVQHAGLFAERRNFRQIDWYESITDHLVKTQSPQGTWGSVEDTAFAIAFLCRGGIVHEPTESENADPVVAEDDLFADQPAE